MELPEYYLTVTQSRKCENVKIKHDVKVGGPNDRSLLIQPYVKLSTGAGEIENEDNITVFILNVDSKCKMLN